MQRYTLCSLYSIRGVIFFKRDPQTCVFSFFGIGNNTISYHFPFLLRIYIIIFRELSLARKRVQEGLVYPPDLRPLSSFHWPNGRQSVDRFSPNYVVTGCRNEEREKKGKKRRKRRNLTSVRRIRRGGPVTQS